jgi:cytochrome P450
VSILLECTFCVFDVILTIPRAWNDGIPTLVAGLGIFAHKALKARQEVIDSCNQYLNGSYDDAAEMTKERIRVMSEYNLPTDDIARMISSFNTALLSNTAPTAFWTLWNIFSRPALLQELRTELEDNAVSSHKTQDGAKSEFELDVAAIKTKCALLLSIFEETQRSETIHANIRKVLEDTKLDNKYVLKKGNYVQIPNAPIHHNGEIWGPDASDFNPRRFVKSDNAPALALGLPSHAFLAWGTAPHLCPARQFASTEILVMVALLVLRMEIEPVGGKWERPASSLGDLDTVLPPKKDVEVEIRVRDGWDGVWKAKMGDSRSRVPLASG